ncbi:MAG: hypothetical protein AABZ53_11650 [Planctomycetota bacterium]
MMRGDSKKRRACGRGVVWACATMGLVCLALHVVCLPYYAGSSVGGFLRWRLEHGRLTVKQSQVESHEAFYVANNTEGLRWAPAGRFFDWKEWSVTVPLWMGWGPSLAAVAVSVVRRRKSSGL